MVKLGFHLQEYRPEVAAAIAATQPTTVKVMGNALNVDVMQDIKTIAPETLLIGRYWKDTAEQKFEDNPEQRAIALVDEIASTGCGPWADAWESYNEVANNLLSPTQVGLLDRFFLAFHHDVQQRWGKQTVIVCSPCGNLGWPGEPQPTDFKLSLAELRTLGSFHGYEWHWGEAQDRTAYLFRPFGLMRQVLEKYPDKKFVFTEMGVTRMAVRGYPHDWGWSHGSPDLGGPYSREEYLQVLTDILLEADKHPALIGVNIFQTGAAGDWIERGFESTSEVREVGLQNKPIYNVSVDLLARIIQGEAAPCDEARVAVAGCLAECLKRGDTEARTVQRWFGQAAPGPRAVELAQGILNGTILPNGFYYCMSQTDVDTNQWIDGDLVIRCGIYANHLYRDWPKEKTK